MAKRQATEAARAEDAEQADGQENAAPAQMVTAQFRLVSLGGDSGADMRPAMLRVAARIDEEAGVQFQQAIMAGEISILLTSREAIGVFESGSGLFNVEIRPA